MNGVQRGAAPGGAGSGADGTAHTATTRPTILHRSIPVWASAMSAVMTLFMTCSSPLLVRCVHVSSGMKYITTRMQPRLRHCCDTSQGIGHHLPSIRSPGSLTLAIIAHDLADGALVAVDALHHPLEPFSGRGPG